MMNKIVWAVTVLILSLAPAAAQKYDGVVDKSVALIGNDIVMLSDIESEAQMMRARGLVVDRRIHVIKEILILVFQMDIKLTHLN